MLEVEVIELFVFDSFKTLYAELPLLECGYTEKGIGTASPNDMDLYYSKEKQQKYGVDIRFVEQEDKALRYYLCEVLRNEAK